MKTVIVFGFVFVVMIMVATMFLGAWGGTVLFTAIGLDWTVRLVGAIVVSCFIAGWLT